MRFRPIILFNISILAVILNMAIFAHALAQANGSVAVSVEQSIRESKSLNGDDTLSVVVKIRRFGTPANFTLGNADFPIQVNTAALDVSSTGMKIIKQGVWSNEGDNTKYLPMTLEKGIGEYVNLRVRQKTINGVGLPLTDTLSLLAELAFRIVKCDTNSGVSILSNNVPRGARLAFNDPTVNIAVQRIPTAPTFSLKLPTPAITASNSAPGVVEFVWNKIPRATAYELEITVAGVTRKETISDPNQTFKFVNASTGQQATLKLVALGKCPGSKSGQATRSITSTYCKLSSDPVVKFSPDSAACLNSPVTITADFKFRGAVSYGVNNNFTKEKTYTFTPTTTGITNFNVFIKDSTSACPVQRFSLRIPVIETQQPTNLAITGAPTGPVCNSAPINFVGSAQGEALRYSWSSGSGVYKPINAKSTEYTPAIGDTGTVTHTLTVSSRGCSPASTSVTVNYLKSPRSNFLVNKEVAVGERIPFELIPIVRTNNTTYRWDFGTGESSTDENPVYAFNTPNTAYTIRLISKDPNCTFEVAKQVKVIRLETLFVPNIFSPSASNPENQVFKVFGTGIDNSSFSLRIFSRWGEIVYEANTFSEANTNGWNGSKNNGSTELPVGTYTYTINGKYLDGSTFEKAGNVTLIR